MEKKTLWAKERQNPTGVTFFENMPHISKVIYMVYFGNLSLFNDVMGEMGPFEVAMINWDPLIA